MSLQIKKDKMIDHGLAFVIMVIWGLTFFFIKELQGTFSSLEILFLRYCVAYAALWLMCPKWVKFNLKQELYFFGAALSGATLYQYLENVSVEYTSPASVSFLTALAPLFTALFAYFFLKEKVTLQTVIGMLISIVGVGLICFGDSKKIETGLLGDVIIICSIWLWAVYSIIVKKIAQFGLPGLVVTRRIFFYSLAVMLVPVIITGNIQRSNFTLPSVLSLLYLGVFASAICFVSVAVNNQPRTIDLLHMTYAQQSIIGSGGYMPEDVCDVQEIMSCGDWNLESIITHEFPLEELEQAIRMAADVGMIIVLLGLFLSEAKLLKRKDKKTEKNTVDFDKSISYNSGNTSE